MTRRVILAFPLNHRRKLVRSIATRMVALPPAEADKYMRAELRRQQRVMDRRGIARATAEAQLAAFESALSAELWRLVMVPPQPRGAA